ncbi:Uncharacterized protein FWK35_00012625 [Aphis craccivora]|uniref:Uncharacterized protein n=1 Tax=Aphis craccivora TaxID=307492 RepID=A0A6G0YND6_APHCR|nr:Uncharacterized protein FWK35_00012625 [Aphis craccivora]
MSMSISISFYKQSPSRLMNYDDQIQDTLNSRQSTNRFGSLRLYTVTINWINLGRRISNKSFQINKLNDCSLLIDNITDLQTFKDKIAIKELIYVGGKHINAIIWRIIA